MKAGDRVVCVHVGNAKELEDGKEYTLAHDPYKIEGILGCGLIEVSPPPRYSDGYALWKFRKIDDKWAEEVLRIAQEESESIPLEI